MKVSIWSPPTPVTAAPTPDRADLTTTIDNGQVRLRFKSAEKGSGLGSLIFVPNQREALRAVDDRPPWWQIAVRTPAGEIRSISNVEAPPARFIPAADKTTGGRFEWQHVTIAGVEGYLDVTVSVATRVRFVVGPAANRSGQPSRRGQPVGRGVSRGQSSRLSRPERRAGPFDFQHDGPRRIARGATGRLYPSYLGAPYVDYPGGGFPIGHMSCTIGDGTVVYVGCHDPSGSTKGYGWTIEDGLRFHVPPANMSVPKLDYRQDWDFVIGPMAGDWFVAALVYRDWATGQFWCAKGRLAERTDLPRSFFEVPYWGDPIWPGRISGQRISARRQGRNRGSAVSPAGRPIRSPGARLRRATPRDAAAQRRGHETYGLPLGLQWYGWHRARFDGNYPQYFPPRPGFPKHCRIRPGRACMSTVF